MKPITLLFLFLFLTGASRAGNPYHTYLLTQLNNKPSPTIAITELTSTTTKDLSVPRYRIPTGAIFCRLEDKLTKATKVWVKIGVE